MRIEDVLIIDVEASGLGPGSWPIEVGIAWSEAGEVRSWSSLIRPEPDWDPEAWDPVAEEMHGISREALDGAPTAWTVATDLLSRVAGRAVFSDAPEHDGGWVRRLLDAQPAPAGIPIRDFDQAVGAVCGERGADWAYERLEQSPPQPPSFREGSRRLSFLRRRFLLCRKEARYIFASCIA